MSNKNKFPTQFDHPKTKGHDFSQTISKTRQEFLAESDINSMMEKYERTGIAPPTTTRPHTYGDFSDPALQDYMTATQVVRGAGELMQALPAKTRARFGNDVAELLLFVADPKNRDEAIELGLINKPPEPPAPPPTEKPK